MKERFIENGKTVINNSFTEVDEPKSCTSANSATSAFIKWKIENGKLKIIVLKI